MQIRVRRRGPGVLGIGFITGKFKLVSAAGVADLGRLHPTIRLPGEFLNLTSWPWVPGQNESTSAENLQPRIKGVSGITSCIAKRLLLVTTYYAMVPYAKGYTIVS